MSLTEEEHPWLLTCFLRVSPEHPSGRIENEQRKDAKGQRKALVMEAACGGPVRAGQARLRALCGPLRSLRV